MTLGSQCSEGREHLYSTIVVRCDECYILGRHKGGWVGWTPRRPGEQVSQRKWESNWAQEEEDE